LSVGGTGSGADTAIYRVPGGAAGMKFKLVKGYREARNQLAMGRTRCRASASHDSLSRGNLARSNQINVLLQQRFARSAYQGCAGGDRAARSRPTARRSNCFRAGRVSPPVRGTARCR
jgi:hypothetical protein